MLLVLLSWLDCLIPEQQSILQIRKSNVVSWFSKYLLSMCVRLSRLLLSLCLFSLLRRCCILCSILWPVGISTLLVGLLQQSNWTQTHPICLSVAVSQSLLLGSQFNSLLSSTLAHTQFYHPVCTVTPSQSAWIGLKNCHVSSNVWRLLNISLCLECGGLWMVCYRMHPVHMDEWASGQPDV